MNQRLVCFDNVDVKPRTCVLYADTINDLYSFMENTFAWFNKERLEIQVSGTRMGTFGRQYLRGDTISRGIEDLYIKVVVKKGTHLNK